VGGLVYLGGKSKVSDAESACPSHKDCTQDVTQKGTDGNSQEKTGSYVAGIGVVAAAGGLVWHFLEKPSQPKTTAINPTVAPGFAGLSYSGQF
jgi:hypothetical protein